jgi:hypothetical protein
MGGLGVSDNGGLSERGRDPSAVAGWRHCRWIGLSTLPGECSTCAPVPTSSSRRVLRRVADHEAAAGGGTIITSLRLLYCAIHSLPTYLPYFSTLAGENSSADHSNVVSQAGLSILPLPCPRFPHACESGFTPLPQPGEHSDHQSVWVVSRVGPRCSHCESLGPQWSSTSVQAPHAQTSSPPASMRFAGMCAALGSTVASFLLLRPVRVVRDTRVPLACVRPLLARAC